MWFSSGCLHQWEIMDKMLWAAAMVAVFLLLLSLLHCPGKAHYEFLSHALNSFGVFSLGVLFFFFQVLPPVQQVFWQAGCLSAFIEGRNSLPWAYFYHQQSGYKMVPLPLLSQPPSLPGDNQNTSFHWCWLSGRLPLLLNCLGSPL